MYLRRTSSLAYPLSSKSTSSMLPLPLQVRNLATRSLPPPKASFCSYTTLLTATRAQHASTPPTAADGQAHEPPKMEAAEQRAQRDGVHIDASRLPSTIPGISQEELAARITAYHTKMAWEASELSSNALAQEVELMRRSLSPDAFEAYMRDLEKGMAAAAKEQAKLAAMSPLELHQYQQKKKRQAVRYEWYKTFMMIFALVGSTALLFSLFLFFE
ncbi:hypothetical protein ABL78_6564 [Leptomonas seymouri]|uniref:Transmembrane protein n=1 Tax=Leptomonas seymouri TaxID=5684 RepID=A0A0N1PCT3_LEPSE|nr:hypothetical protein ABL78_6564 [Leptomonas seymouri]|eukprot:KPI84383.1 hypothetical protein ABL78_6564 [Leptomonas seymouri]